jgi:hypothetical protein
MISFPRGWLLALCTVVLLAATAKAATIFNGSFETPDIGGGFVNITMGGATQIAGWTVVQNNVDIVHSGFGPTFAADGNQWIDLNGNAGPGAIQTTITGLIFGRSYLLSFEFSSYPLPPFDDPKPFDVSVDGTKQSFLTLGGGPQVWLPGSLQFVAGASSATLTVTSTYSANPLSGAFVDNFTIVEVPEPATFVVMCFGLAVIACRRSLRAHGPVKCAR